MGCAASTSGTQGQTAGTSGSAGRGARKEQGTNSELHALDSATLLASWTAALPRGWNRVAIPLQSPAQLDRALHLGAAGLYRQQRANTQKPSAAESAPQGTFGFPKWVLEDDELFLYVFPTYPSESVESIASPSSSGEGEAASIEKALIALEDRLASTHRPVVKSEAVDTKPIATSTRGLRIVIVVVRLFSTPTDDSHSEPKRKEEVKVVPSPSSSEEKQQGSEPRQVKGRDEVLLLMSPAVLEANRQALQRYLEPTDEGENPSNLDVDALKDLSSDEETDAHLDDDTQEEVGVQTTPLRGRGGNSKETPAQTTPLRGKGAETQTRGTSRSSSIAGSPASTKKPHGSAHQSNEENLEPRLVPVTEENLAELSGVRAHRRREELGRFLSSCRETAASCKGLDYGSVLGTRAITAASSDDSQGEAGVQVEGIRLGLKAEGDPTKFRLASPSPLLSGEEVGSSSALQIRSLSDGSGKGSQESELDLDGSGGGVSVPLTHLFVGGSVMTGGEGENLCEWLMGETAGTTDGRESNAISTDKVTVNSGGGVIATKRFDCTWKRKDEVGKVLEQPIRMRGLGFGADDEGGTDLPLRSRIQCTSAIYPLPGVMSNTQTSAAAAENMSARPSYQRFLNTMDRAEWNHLEAELGTWTKGTRTGTASPSSSISISGSARKEGDEAVIVAASHLSTQAVNQAFPQFDGLLQPCLPPVQVLRQIESYLYPTLNLPSSPPSSSPPPSSPGGLSFSVTVRVRMSGGGTPPPLRLSYRWNTISTEAQPSVGEDAISESFSCVVVSKPTPVIEPQLAALASLLQAHSEYGLPASSLLMEYRASLPLSHSSAASSVASKDGVCAILSLAIRFDTSESEAARSDSADASGQSRGQPDREITYVLLDGSKVLMKANGMGGSSDQPEVFQQLVVLALVEPAR